MAEKVDKHEPRGSKLGHLPRRPFYADASEAVTKPVQSAATALRTKTAGSDASSALVTETLAVTASPANSGRSGDDDAQTPAARSKANPKRRKPR